MKQYRQIAMATIFAAFALVCGEARAQCYPGLGCPDAAESGISTPTVQRPHSPAEDCALDGSIRYCVSSALAPQGQNHYNAANLIDGNSKTAWVEGRSDDGTGEWIVIDFNQPEMLGSLQIQNGYAKNTDIYKKNNRVKDLEIILSDGQIFRQSLRDEPAPQTILFNNARDIQWLQLKIVSVHPGSKYRDTAISEIRIFGQ